MRSVVFARLLLFCGVTIRPSAGIHALNAESGANMVILLAVRKGIEGESHLREWSTYAEKFNDNLPPVWVLCPNETLEDSVHQLPLVRSFKVDPQRSWAVALETFVLEHDAWILGLFGEGSTPDPDLAESVMTMGPPFSKMEVPSALMSRSRSRDTGEWLPDTFVSHTWVNRDMLEPSRLNKMGLGLETVHDLPLLGVLSLVISQPPDVGGVFVDGTNVLGATFAASRETGDSILSLPKHSRAARVYIGTLSWALIHLKDGLEADIVRAPWPPRYVLETVATEDGLVIVSNVNCGYLDMAVNFMLSVKRTSGKKVLFVAMDEVSFDFLDTLAPGCIVLFPVEDGAERKHASKAGTYGGRAFAEEVLVRPSILEHIMAQGYNQLWSDSDMVWLGNPLPLLPDMTNASSADVMLQHDGYVQNTCTCFMFLKPSPLAQKLLILWKRNIVDSHSTKNQPPLQKPLQHMKNSGLKVEYISNSVMPHGAAFFRKRYVENYAQVVRPEAIIVHDNYIRGHEKKKDRFQKYHLWSVEGIMFPTCEE